MNETIYQICDTLLIDGETGFDLLIYPIHGAYDYILTYNLAYQVGHFFFFC